MINVSFNYNKKPDLVDVVLFNYKKETIRKNPDMVDHVLFN